MKIYFIYLKGLKLYFHVYPCIDQMDDVNVGFRK